MVKLLAFMLVACLVVGCKSTNVRTGLTDEQRRDSLSAVRYIGKLRTRVIVPNDMDSIVYYLCGWGRAAPSQNGVIVGPTGNWIHCSYAGNAYINPALFAVKFRDANENVARYFESIGRYVSAFKCQEPRVDKSSFEAIASLQGAKDGFTDSANYFFSDDLASTIEKASMELLESEVKNKTSRKKFLNLMRRSCDSSDCWSVEQKIMTEDSSCKMDTLLYCGSESQFETHLLIGRTRTYF